MTHILHINSSGRMDGSYSRKLSAELVEQLVERHPGAEVVVRDVAPGVEFLDQAWIEANFTPSSDRTDEQAARLVGSDALVAELQAADILVIAAPIYNFSDPGALKAWIDQICRAGVTFQYGPNGPEGLLEGKKAYVVMTSGGTEVRGPVDFATDYLTHVLGFIGITDVEVVDAGRLMADEAQSLQSARTTIAQAA